MQAIVGEEIPKEVKNLFLYATVAARIVYGKNWKEKITPTKEQWLHKLIEFVELMSMMAKIRNQDENTVT